MVHSSAGFEMKGNDDNNNNNAEEEQACFEIGVVVPKRFGRLGNERYDCVEVLVNEFEKVGLMVDRVLGMQFEFIKCYQLQVAKFRVKKLTQEIRSIPERLSLSSIKRKECILSAYEKSIVEKIVKVSRRISKSHLLCNLAAPVEVLGRAAVALQLKKQTRIGVDVQFEWEEAEAFVRQPDGALFSWCERFRCYHHIIYGIVNKSESGIALRSESIEIFWKPMEPLLRKLESLGVVKEVFPLHDEVKRKQLIKRWALNWRDFTYQPIDEIYSYFGMKIATYFAFLGMYTRWILFPAALGLTLQFVDFGSFQLLVLPFFFMSLISWAVLFSQFWKRKNSAMLARWQVSYSVRDSRSKFLEMEQSSLQSSVEYKNNWTAKPKEKEVFQREEWFGHMRRLRNDAIIITSIICLQLPFELAYAHLYEVIEFDIVKFLLTASYLFIIQYFTKFGGKISVKLIMHEKNENREYRADSLVYKVFGLYFMQSYIGIFYHALLHRNFVTLRQVLIQRLIVSEVLENLLENSIPYLKYSYRKHRAICNRKKREKGSSTEKIENISRVEKEYLKPAYLASVGEELEDGVFDDLLEVALQFGMIMMFACAFPPAFAFAALNNITEIRADALKLLVMLRRPSPRAAATIGAWLNIFQFLIVMSICTNCVLLVCLYDREGEWHISPGLTAILIMEHILLIIKFGFSRIVPEEPDWVKARRMSDATQAQNIYSKQLLRSISGEKKREQKSELKKKRNVI